MGRVVAGEGGTVSAGVDFASSGLAWAITSIKCWSCVVS